MDPNTSVPLSPQTPPTSFGSTPVTPVTPPMNTSQESEKYKVFTAVRDVFSSIVKNPLATLLPIALVIVAGFIVSALTVMAFALAGFSAAASGGSGLTADFIIKLAVIFGAGFLLQIIVATGFTNAYMLALRSSYDGDQKPVSTYLKDGFRLFGRTIGAVILSFLAIITPGLVLLIAAASVNFLLPSMAIVNIILFVAGALSVIWSIVASIRFVLAVQVAIFERDVPLRKVLGRSNHLMTKGGQWFAIKTFILLAIVSAIVNALAGGGNTSGSEGQMSIVGSLLLSIMTPFIYGIMVMLHRNRVAVKK